MEVFVGEVGEHGDFIFVVVIWGYVYESYGLAVLVEPVNREDGRWDSNLDGIMFSLYDTMDDLPFTIPIQDSIASWQIPDIKSCHVISRIRIV